MTFAATANAIAYTGAEPYFVDCDPETANMDAGLLEDALHALAAQGRNVAAVVPVDLFGKCCDYELIEKIVGEAGPRLLCDAAEAMGATHHARPAGSIGDAAALSFNGNKILTTSGGGMLLTHSAEFAERVRYLSTQARQPVAHYEHTEVGYNYRLSNILAALGRAQLVRFDSMLARRRHWRERYRTLIASYAGIEILGGADDREDNCWLTAITVDGSIAGITAAELRASLGAADIESRPVWMPMHMQPAFRHCAGTINGSAERLFDRGVILPSGSGMELDDFARVESVVQAALQGAPDRNC
jgi:dTDP-4-amino-4,6-dideoxygalactose transaminase